LFESELRNQRLLLTSIPSKIIKVAQLLQGDNMVELIDELLNRSGIDAMIMLSKN
jgi:hypothetical protein